MQCYVLLELKVFLIQISLSFLLLTGYLSIEYILSRDY